MSRAHGHRKAIPMSVTCPTCSAEVGQNCRMQGYFGSIFHASRRDRAYEVEDLVAEREGSAPPPPKKPQQPDWALVRAILRKKA
jgi:hypothetical protein